MRGKFGALCLFVILTAPFTARAATYYVATPANGGNNSNPGTQAQPFATIQHAANQTGAGDTVIVTPGTYAAGAFIDHSGNSGLPITIQGQPGAIVTGPGVGGFNPDNFEIRASYITIEGFEIHSAGRAGISVIGDVNDESLGVVVRNNFCHDNGVWGIFTGYAKDILIEYNETSNSGDEHGIYVSNSSDNPIIRFNVVHHNIASGIQINADPALPGDGIVTNAVIDSNIIYENGQIGGAAINLASVRNSLIINNLLYNNDSGGIAGWDDGFCPCGGGQFTFGTRDNKFLNNTIIQPSNGRVVVSLLNGSINNEIRNNILIHLGTRPSVNTDSTSQPGINSDYNLVKDTFSADDGDTFITLALWQALGAGHDQNSIIYNNNAASLFVNSGANDYHILDGSQAHNTGTTVASVTDDLDGVPRPQGGVFDIGCYESHNQCLFCDDFENNTIDGWTFLKGSWSETGGRLNGSHTKKADILSPAAWGGCSQCTIEALMNVSAGGRVSLLGWYIDKKNYVEITLMEDKNKLMLKRKVNGSVTTKGKFLTPINANQDYRVVVEFNGTNLVVFLDGPQAMSLNAGAPAPLGIVGFQIKPTGASVNASFEEIVVY